MTAMSHLTCVGHSVAELRSIVGSYAAPGSATSWPCAVTPRAGSASPGSRIPRASTTPTSSSPSCGARRLHRGVAAFPDGHPESGYISEDAETLIRKERAGAEFAITQMVFDVDNYLRLRDELARRGSRLPVVPAIMPITNARQVVRMAQLAGQPMPTAVTDRLKRHGDDAAGVRAEGMAIATESSRRLLDEGASGIHFITMNRSSATLEVFGNL